MDKIEKKLRKTNEMLSEVVDEMAIILLSYMTPKEMEELPFVVKLKEVAKMLIED